MFPSTQFSSPLPVLVHCYSSLRVTTTAQLVEQREMGGRKEYSVACMVMLCVLLFIHDTVLLLLKKKQTFCLYIYMHKSCYY